MDSVEKVSYDCNWIYRPQRLTVKGRKEKLEQVVIEVFKDLGTFDPKARGSANMWHDGAGEYATFENFSRLSGRAGMY